MPGKRTALVIACSKYQDARLQQLQAPAQDAEALADVLGDSDIGEFDVRVLQDKSKSVVEVEIERHCRGAGREDFLLLYFSGHGITDQAPQRTLYFAARETDIETLQATAISAGFINNMMRVTRARQQLLLLDCCHSGAFKWEMVKSSPSAGVLDSFPSKTIEEGAGRAVITATQAMQYALQDDTIKGAGIQSVFTRWLVKGLETGDADGDGDGHVSVLDLFEYLERHASQPNQTPEMNYVGKHRNIKIAKNPKAPSKLPIKIQEAIRSQEYWERLGVVSALKDLLEAAGFLAASEAWSALDLLAKDSDSRVKDLASKALKEVTSPLTGGFPVNPSLAYLWPRSSGLSSLGLVSDPDLYWKLSPELRRQLVDPSLAKLPAAEKKPSTAGKQPSVSKPSRKEPAEAIPPPSEKVVLPELPKDSPASGVVFPTDFYSKLSPELRRQLVDPSLAKPSQYFRVGEPFLKEHPWLDPSLLEGPPPVISPEPSTKAVSKTSQSRQPSSEPPAPPKALAIMKEIIKDWMRANGWIP
jgi:hypothetical protein